MFYSLRWSSSTLHCLYQAVSLEVVAFELSLEDWVGLHEVGWRGKQWGGDEEGPLGRGKSTCWGLLGERINRAKEWRRCCGFLLFIYLYSGHGACLLALERHLPAARKLHSPRGQRVSEPGIRMFILVPGETAGFSHRSTLAWRQCLSPSFQMQGEKKVSS